MIFVGADNSVRPFDLRKFDGRSKPYPYEYHSAFHIPYA